MGSKKKVVKHQPISPKGPIRSDSHPFFLLLPLVIVLVLVGLVLYHQNDDDCSEDDDDSQKCLKFILYRNGGGNYPSRENGVPFYWDLRPHYTWSQFTITAYTELGIRMAPECNTSISWKNQELRHCRVHHSIYDHEGNMITSVSHLQGQYDRGDPLFLLFREHFVWPTFEVGANIALNGLVETKTIPNLYLHTLSLSPRVFLIDNLLTSTECETLINMAKPLMSSSELHSSSNSTDTLGNSTYRTSSTGWLPPKTQPVINIEKRIANILQIPYFDMINSPKTKIDENFQVIHYLPYQHYHGHLDLLSKSRYQNSKDIQEGCNRLLTLLIYLNDVESGGETIFYYGNRTSPVEAQEKLTCGDGLKVQPKRGSAVLFYNMLAEDNINNPKFDDKTLHGGCDVVNGEKWAINKWIWNKPCVYDVLRMYSN